MISKKAIHNINNIQPKKKQKNWYGKNPDRMDNSTIIKIK